jgi:ParB-like chromosome segregation protein Spo0J
MTPRKWSGEWHPLSLRFPMLAEDELREMAVSITERGQYVPCRMDADGLGLDGRNRVAACALAGAEPWWEVYDGDPVAFIVEVNAAAARS